MIIQFYDHDSHVFFCLKPENMTESNMLLRLCNNRKQVPISMNYNFSYDIPVLNVSIEKVKKHNQINFIRKEKLKTK